MFDRTFGSPLLPSCLRRARSNERGELTLFLDTEDHDLGLLRSIAEAVRADDEVAGLLRQYAEVMNRRDEMVRDGRTAHLEWHALNEDAADIRGQIDAAMEWQPIGEGLISKVRTHEAGQLAEELLELVPEKRITSTGLKAVGA